MKKIFLVVLGMSFALPFMASAASFTISPSSGTYQVGDSIVLNVSVNPAGSTIYTAMLDTRFSSDTVEVSSFTLNDSLLPLKTSGYDALDNAGGVLTKTGGYTGGIAATSPFGIIVLHAKAPGTGTFTVSDSSKLLDLNNTDQQTGTQTATYTIVQKQITSPVTAQTQESAQPASNTASIRTSNAATINTHVSTSESSSTSVSGTSASEVASAANAVAISFWTWISWLVSLVIAFGIGYFVGKRS